MMAKGEEKKIYSPLRVFLFPAAQKGFNHSAGRERTFLFHAFVLGSVFRKFSLEEGSNQQERGETNLFAGHCSLFLINDEMPRLRLHKNSRSLYSRRIGFSGLSERRKQLTTKTFPSHPRQWLQQRGLYSRIQVNAADEKTIKQHVQYQKPREELRMLISISYNEFFPPIHPSGLHFMKTFHPMHSLFTLDPSVSYPRNLLKQNWQMPILHLTPAGG